MNFYEVLGVDEDADEAAVRSAYREKARRYHPDVNDHPEAGDQFRVLTRARDVLTDPGERAAYDRLGHADYVDKRIDGDFPSPEMPTDSGASDDGGSREDTSGGDAGAGSRRNEGDDAGERPDADTATGRSAGASSAADATSPTNDATSSTHDATSSPDDVTSSGGPDDADRSPAGGATDSSAGTSSSASGDAATGDTSGKSHSVPPTPGASESASTTGASRSKPRGPERVSKETTPEGSTLRRHVTVSTRWVGVLAAAGVYAAGLAGFLGAGATGIGRLVAALASSDPAAVAGALGGARYGAADPLTYGLTTGAAGVVLLLGAVLLPVAVAMAVAGLRRRTTWRPTWMHVVGALGPAAAVVLAYAAMAYPGAVPLSPVPLLLDLLLLAAFPAVVVVSFLGKRLLVVYPLRHRDEVLT